MDREAKAIITIQANVRGWLHRLKYERCVLKEFDQYEGGALIPFRLIGQFLNICKKERDKRRFIRLCTYITDSLDVECYMNSYVGELLSDNSLLWIAQLKNILTKCLSYLRCYDCNVEKKMMDMRVEYQSAGIFLKTLLRYTHIGTWRFLYESTSLLTLQSSMAHLCCNIMGHLLKNGFYPVLRNFMMSLQKQLQMGENYSGNDLLVTCSNAVFILTTRPILMMAAENTSSHDRISSPSDKNRFILELFLRNIFTIPSFLSHYSEMILSVSGRSLTSGQGCSLVPKEKYYCFVMHVICHLGSDCKEDVILSLMTRTDDAMDILFLIGNITEMASIYSNILKLNCDKISDDFHPLFLSALDKLIRACSMCLTKGKNNLKQWHPILGWYSIYFAGMNEGAKSYGTGRMRSDSSQISKQISLLWSPALISELLIAPLSFSNECLPVVKSDKLQGIDVTSLIVTCKGNVCMMENPNGNASSNSNAAVWDGSDASNHVGYAGRAYAKLRKIFLDLKQRQLYVYDVSPSLVPEYSNVIKACNLYYSTLKLFIHLRSDILTGLCYYECGIFLKRFWTFLLDVYDGLKTFYWLVNIREGMKDDPIVLNIYAQDSHVLIFFCQCLTHYITILDDVEMYEKQRSIISLTDLSALSIFLNYFVYAGITNEVLCVKSGNEETLAFEKEESDLFENVYILLKLLYTRDCRRRFTEHVDQWVIPTIKLPDLYSSKPSICALKEKIPHVIPYKVRVTLLRKMIGMEKFHLMQRQCAGNVQNRNKVKIIRVRRFRILEDAISQFKDWNVQDMKKSFRIKFVNARGLEEAGIDQAGISREFMSEVLSRLFDPNMNLFQSTKDGYAYPSPLSHATPGHLELLEFTGQMIAKALYEGIVIEPHLASFFLNQVMGGMKDVPTYSYIDELPSFDQELYKSLMYVKHCEHDVENLCLTFSTSEDLFGKISTFELIPGGKDIIVNNSNRLIYIHMMARFRMYTQIKEQTSAFAKGFNKLFTHDLSYHNASAEDSSKMVTNGVLSMFSIPELQLLISGTENPLDMVELRQNTRYYGGFHDSHKVIIWLWDIVMNEFSDEERVLFFKFITSSSKAPTLGFSSMNPPFSIRCVPLNEEPDNVNTIRSVASSLLTFGGIRRRRKQCEDRLPSSSTCFNLLKLPNYSKKSILRGKLRYAIHSNAGFELS